MPDDLPLAVVTGGARGIGEAIVAELVTTGHRVAVVDVNPKAIARTQETDGARAGLVVPVELSITDREAVERELRALRDAYGPVRALVNNAGMTRRAPTEEMPDEVWHEIIRTNLDGVFFMSRAVGRHMIPRKRGSIINICSVMSELGQPTIVPYTASKGGVKMMTKGLAADWGKHGIRVNGIGPGYFTTPLNKALIDDEKFSAWVASRTPLARWGDTEELVGAAIYLASDAASFVTGHVLFVDGGLTAVV